MSAGGIYPWAPGYYDDGDRPQIVTSRFRYEDSHTIERFHETGGTGSLRIIVEGAVRSAATYLRARPFDDVPHEAEWAVHGGEGVDAAADFTSPRAGEWE